MSGFFFGGGGEFSNKYEKTNFGKKIVSLTNLTEWLEIIIQITRFVQELLGKNQANFSLVWIPEFKTYQEIETILS